MEVLIEGLNDGLELYFNGADLGCGEVYSTSVMVSLFGGDCFYNVFRENKTDKSFFEAINKPVTVENLKNAEIIAKRLLKWLVDDEFIEDLEVFCYGDKNGKFNTEITFKEFLGVEVQKFLINSGGENKWQILKLKV